MILPLVVLVGIFLIAFKSYLICYWFYFWEWLILHTFWTHQWQPFKEENLEKNTQRILFSKWNIHYYYSGDIIFKNVLTLFHHIFMEHHMYILSIHEPFFYYEWQPWFLSKTRPFILSFIFKWTETEKVNYKRNLWQELPKDFKKKKQRSQKGHLGCKKEWQVKKLV